MENRIRNSLTPLFVAIALVIGLCPGLALATTSADSPEIAAATTTSLAASDDGSQGESGEGAEGDGQAADQGTGQGADQGAGQGDATSSESADEPAAPAEPTEPADEQATPAEPSEPAKPAVVSLEGAVITLSQTSYVYDGFEKKPAVSSVIIGGTTVPMTGYSTEYANNMNAGKATVVVTGKDGFEGSASTTFEIKPARASKLAVKIPAQTYDGTAKTPAPVVTFNGKVLKAGSDYTVKGYANNENAGTASATIAGTGNFTGKRTVSFKIEKAPVAGMSVAKIASKTFTGSAITPKPKVTFGGKPMKLGRDYTVNYASNKSAGKASATIVGKGNFTGKRTVSFKIGKAAIAKASVGKIASMTYTGSALTPKVALTFGGKKLKLGSDYTLRYASNTNAGWASVTIAGKGNFGGARTVKFAIAKAPISRATSTKIPSRTFTGSAITLRPTLRFGGKVLKLGSDYTLRYASNTNAGQAKVYVYGRGNFTGSMVLGFTIRPASILRAAVASIGDCAYTGGAIEPSPAVTFYGKTLVRNRDYSLSYSNNVRAGTANVSVKGIGNFYGAKTVHFRINAPAPEPEPEPEADDSDDGGDGGDTVYITRTGEKYHRDGCSSLRSSRIPISRSDAIARGFEPCKNCRP